MKERTFLIKDRSKEIIVKGNSYPEVLKDYLREKYGLNWSKFYVDYFTGRNKDISISELEIESDISVNERFPLTASYRDASSYFGEFPKIHESMDVLDKFTLKLGKLLSKKLGRDIRVEISDSLRIYDGDRVIGIFPVELSKKSLAVKISSLNHFLNVKEKTYTLNVEGDIISVSAKGEREAKVLGLKKSGKIREGEEKFADRFKVEVLDFKEGRKSLLEEGEISLGGWDLIVKGGDVYLIKREV